MQTDKSAISNEHAKNVLIKWIDNDYEIDTNALIEKQWSAILVADTINPMEAEWLSEAIIKIGIKNAISITFEYEGVPSIASIKIGRDAILKFNTDNSSNYAILTSIDEDFIYFKEQENRYFLLCGSSNFIKDTYKCSFETAKLMYFDYWVDDEYNTKEEKLFMTRIWEKYRGHGDGTMGT